MTLHLYPQKLAIASPTSGGRSVGIVRTRTQTMEFSFFNSGGTVELVFPLYWKSEPQNKSQYRWGLSQCVPVILKGRRLRNVRVFIADAVLRNSQDRKFQQQKKRSLVKSPRFGSTPRLTD
jgi:hypothetical protein